MKNRALFLALVAGTLARIVRDGRYLPLAAEVTCGGVKEPQ